MKKTPAMIWCMMLCTAASYGYVIIGGIGFFLLRHVDSELVLREDIVYYNVDVIIDEYIDGTRVKGFLIVNGILVLLASLFSATVARNQYTNVGDKVSYKIYYITT